MPTLTTAVLRYLHEVLGIEARAVKPWARANELPYFLRDAFQFSELELLGQPIVLAIGRAQAKQSLSEVRTWLDKVQALAGQPAVYVTDALASYDRRRLIEQKVPFIVPGNQLYLPDLGLDLREYFRRRTPATEALSPSAQAMLITALLRQPWQSDWQPSEIAVALGYTPMTLSRAVKELTAAGLATAYTVGRSRWLRMELPPGQVWERAKPALRTPVRRTVWVAAHGTVAHRPSRLAGLSALARYSMLTEPKWPVFALAAADWKAATDAGVRELPEPEAGAQEWQLWSYSPALVPDADTVDPLSLTLSLQENADDRIQLALDELKGRLPW
ncbi:MarR family transcriptional regulator [Variovorax sp. V116]|uniref:MarR family transcriptional regulator n=1 Tax=Variovorax sp. V116 TaxID=3065953 RepID=UPI0034E8EC73